nr:tyrosine-type recombinase/integrase [Halorubrum laminariae]
MGDDKHWLKPEQVEAMRAAARDGRHALRDDAIVTLLYDTGLRRGELSRVDHAMLDLEDGLLRLPTSIQKGYPNDSEPPPVTFQLDRDGSLRTVATLKEYLDARVDDAPALVSSQKAGRMTGKGINDVVQRAARRAGVRPYCFSGRGGPKMSLPTHSATASRGGCCALRMGTLCTTSEIDSATRRSSRPSASTTTSRQSEMHV